MGAFGRLAPSITPFADFNPDPNATSSVTPVGVDKGKGMGGPMRRRGLFGGFFTPERLAIIGAGLRQAGGVDGALTQTMQQQFEATRQRAEDEWRQRQQEYQTRQWKYGDQQQQAQDDLVNAAPADLQPYVRAAPEAYATGSITQALRPSGGRPMTRDEARAYGLQPGTSGWIDSTGEPHVLQQPYHPPASMMGSGGDGSTFTPNPAGVAAPAVGSVEDGYRYNGGDPADPNSWEQVR